MHLPYSNIPTKSVNAFSIYTKLRFKQRSVDNRAGNIYRRGIKEVSVFPCRLIKHRRSMTTGFDCFD